MSSAGQKPSFRDVWSVRSVRTPVMSRDGLSVVYTVRSADWEKNEFDTEIWLARDNDAPFQLTRTKDGSSSSPRWSPDGKWLSFLSSRDDKTEVYLINPLGGEASRLTEHGEGISTYRWSPDGSQIAFSSPDSLSSEMKSRSELYGEFAIDDEEYRLTHLWILDVEPGKVSTAHRLTSGEGFTVGSFNWSPD